MLKRISSLLMALALAVSALAAAPGVGSKGHACRMAAMPEMACCRAARQQHCRTQTEALVACCIESDEPQPRQKTESFSLRLPAFSTAQHSMRPEFVQAPLLLAPRLHGRAEDRPPNYQHSYICNLTLLI